MSGISISIMAWTSVTSAQSGNKKTYGSNGSIMLQCVSPKISDNFWCSSTAKSLITHTEPEPTILSQFKTNKNKIKIEINDSGNPKNPSISMGDSYHSKVLQAMLRDYCTIHIHMFRDILHKPRILTYNAQNTPWPKHGSASRGRRCARCHQTGS